MKVETEIEPQRLDVILDALRREGRDPDADRVARTYDLKTGKVLEAYLDKADAPAGTALSKSAAWDPNTLRYQSWNNSVWQPYVQQGQSSGGGAQNGLVRIRHYGGTGAPILSVQVSNYYNQWSTARKWNEVVGWPDATGYPTYGLFKIKITTTNALGRNNYISTYRVLASQTGWSAWASQGGAAGPTPSGSGSNFMQAFEYKINLI